MVALKWMVIGALLLCGTVLAAEDPVDEGDVTADEGATLTEQEDDGTVGPASDAQVSFLITHPTDAHITKEFTGGKAAKFLIGFQNRGEKDFVIRFADASFRYHMDYNFPIQNFTAAQYNRRVVPKEEVTLDYGIYAHEQFAGRPFGLVIQLHYEDLDRRYFVNTIFNETITIQEDDSGFSTETGFLYLVFAGFIVLLLLIGQHFLNKLTRKHGVGKKRVASAVETGTSSKAEVDFEWIPRDVLKQAEKKSPKPGSPRQRKAQRAD